MNLAKEMKKKRDSEKRLEQHSPTVIFTEKVEGGEGKSYNDYSNFATKKQLNDGLGEKSGIEHSHNFIDLEDTPLSYVGQAGKVVKVNSNENGFVYEERIGNILPTASVNYRGQIFTLLGGAGVADISYVCIKNSTDAYVWKEI